MTFTDGGLPTLPELMTRLDPGGATAMVTDVLAREKPILNDIVWKEGNLPTGHQITLTDTSLPSGTWRKANQGVVSTKGNTATYVETCARLEDHSRIDEAVAELNGGSAWLATEDAIKVEGLGQQVEDAVLYSSATSNPEEPHGIIPRYPGTSGYRTSSYTFAGTNAGVNARSILAVTWEDRRVYGIYPKGTKGGLERNDKGLIPVLDSQATPGTFFAYVTQYVWRMGIAVEDYRFITRAQWDPDDAEMATTERGLIRLVSKMLLRLHRRTAKTRLYMDRTSMELLNAQCDNAENSLLKYLAMDGGKMIGDAASMGGDLVPHFRGTPIRMCDALTAETAIS